MPPLLGLALLLSIPTLAGDPVMSQEPTDHPRVALETSKGTIVVELDREQAPVSTENFLAYVDDGFYDGTIFHRVISGFMIQGGGFDGAMNKKATKPPIQNEAANGLKNDRGSLAMARTNDPHSATAQFFINVADNAPLDHTAKTMQGWGYTVFAHVAEGMDVADAIVAVRTTSKGPHQNVPAVPVVIEKATVVGESAP
jgi:peptidyl-prolyl cis-trans isomerase B (cyclophilin B)